MSGVSTQPKGDEVSSSNPLQRRSARPYVPPGRRMQQAQPAVINQHTPTTSQRYIPLDTPQGTSQANNTQGNNRHNNQLNGNSVGGSSNYHSLHHTSSHYSNNPSTHHSRIHPSSHYNYPQGGNNSISTTHTPHSKQSWHTRENRGSYREIVDEIFSQISVPTGINFDSYDSIPVEISGDGASQVKPIDSFQSAPNIADCLMANVHRVNYSRPTPVQKHSIPVILSGRDLMACAQTGSGKTAAFLFPIIANMLLHGPPPPPPPASQVSYRRFAYPVCLVLSPTRELAIQIFQESRKFAFNTGIRTVVMYGGSDVKSQCHELDRGCDIAVATPGRLLDLMERRRVNLSTVRHLVLDEADRMLDMGFFPQIRAIVLNSDMPQTRDGRQTVMFSATFPVEIQQLARDFMDSYVFLSVGRVGSTNSFIRQTLEYVQDQQKPQFLLKLLHENKYGLILVFVETKKRADMIEDYLMNNDLPAVSIHGDRSQPEREEALNLFKSGRRRILVATDVAARGLDIPNITHVINCDLPSNIEDYVHRIGRTGRAGNKGLATSYVNENNWPVMRDLMSLMEESDQEVPRWFNALVMQMTSAGRGGMGGRNRGRSVRGGGVRDIRGGENHWSSIHNSGNGSRKQFGGSSGNSGLEVSGGWDAW